MRRFWQLTRSRIAIAMAIALPALALLATGGVAALAAADKLELKITLGDGDNKVDGGGRFYLEDGTFQYTADHLTFNGKIAGDDFTLDGTYTSIKPKAERKFTLVGKIISGHFAGAVTDSGGRKLGTLSFDLKEE